METIKLSNQGQITIPKTFRRSLCWEVGQELVVVSVGDGLLLRPCSPFPETTIDDAAGCLRYQGKSKTLAEMEHAIAQAVRAQQRGIE